MPLLLLSLVSFHCKYAKPCVWAVVTVTRIRPVLLCCSTGRLQAAGAGTKLFTGEEDPRIKTGKRNWLTETQHHLCFSQNTEMYVPLGGQEKCFFSLPERRERVREKKIKYLLARGNKKMEPFQLIISPELCHYIYIYIKGACLGFLSAIPYLHQWTNRLRSEHHCYKGLHPTEDATVFFCTEYLDQSQPCRNWR